DRSLDVPPVRPRLLRAPDAGVRVSSLRLQLREGLARGPLFLGDACRAWPGAALVNRQTAGRSEGQDTLEIFARYRTLPRSWHMQNSCSSSSPRTLTFLYRSRHTRTRPKGQSWATCGCFGGA